MWLEITNSETNKKELVNMAVCHNIEGDESGCKLWFFGADNDTTINVSEPYSAFKAATGAKGR